MEMTRNDAIDKNSEEFEKAIDGMFGEVTEGNHIDWSDYASEDHTAGIELLAEFVNENMRITRNIPTTFNGYIDYSWDGLKDTLDDMGDADIESDDEISSDPHDYEDQTFTCEHCNQEFDSSWQWMEHAIEYVQQNYEEDERIAHTIEDKEFLKLLYDNIWNTEGAMTVEQYMVRFVVEEGNNLFAFFEYMKDKGTIPEQIWNKFVDMRG